MEVAIIPESQIEKDVNDALSIASKMLVTTNEEEAFAVEFCKIIKNAQKQVNDEFDAGVEDAHALHKKLVAQRAKYLTPLKEAEDHIKTLIKSFRLELERKRKEEEIKRQEALDAFVKAQQDQLMKEAELAKSQGDTEKADKLAIASISIESGGVSVSSKSVKQSGMSAPLVWKAKVVDQSLLPKEYLIITPNQKALDEFAKKNDNRIPIAGVEYYQDVNLSIRR